MDHQKALEGREKAKKTWDDAFSDFLRAHKGNLRQYFLGLPKVYKKRWLNCFTGKSSKPDAIRAKCFDCVAYENVKNEIINCAVRTCPLWQFRPYREE